MKKKEVIIEDGQSKYNNAEHSDFHAAAHQYLVSATAEVFNCTDDELAQYAEAQKAEEELIGRQSADLLTADIQEGDTERDGLYSYMCSQIDSAAKCPMPAIKKAAQQLQTILKPFRGIAEKALAQENTEIRSLIEKLNAAPEQLAAIAGLAETIAALGEANEKVANLMSTRTGSAQAKAEALAKRAITDDCYYYIVQRINSTIVLQDSPEVQQLKTEINNLIIRTQNVYHTRMGVIHAKDEKNSN